MQVVCEATQCISVPVRVEQHKVSFVLCCFIFSQVQVAALQCLVKIMSLYYVYMESYMGPALFAVSWSLAINK